MSRSTEKIRKKSRARSGHSHVSERDSRDVGELYGVSFGDSDAKSKRKPPKRRRHAVSRRNKRILIISEDQHSTHKFADSLSRNHEHSYELFTIGVPGLALKAVDRHHPDVIVADNHYDKSKIGYWDVMTPVISAHPEIRVIVLSESKKHGKDLPTRSSYFDGRKVISKQDARWQETLMEEIANTVGS